MSITPPVAHKILQRTEGSILQRSAADQWSDGLSSLVEEVHSQANVDPKLVSLAVTKLYEGASQYETVSAALSALKRHDDCTFRHSVGVSVLMVAFAHILNCDPSVVSEYAVGGILHDIGKITVPQDILNKAGKLTQEEMSTVKTHSRAGYQYLQNMAVSSIVLDICLHHHERFDGAGYPDGIKGLDIPQAARVAAICDVYDALTNARSYKRAWSTGKTMDVMTNSPGHFDPDLLEVFISEVIRLKC